MGDAVVLMWGGCSNQIEKDNNFCLNALAKTWNLTETSHDSALMSKCLT